MNLQQLPLFQGIEHRDMQNIVAHTRFDFHKAEAGQTIVSEGDPMHHLLFVLGGTIHATRQSDSRRYSITETLNAPLLIHPEHLFGLHPPRRRRQGRRAAPGKRKPRLPAQPQQHPGHARTKSRSPKLARHAAHPPPAHCTLLRVALLAPRRPQDHQHHHARTGCRDSRKQKPRLEDTSRHAIRRPAPRLTRHHQHPRTRETPHTNHLKKLPV